MRLFIKYCIATFLAAAALAVAPLSAQERSERDVLIRELRQSQDSLGRLGERREQMRKRLEELSAEVARLKTSVEGRGFSPVEQYRLGERLRSSQSLADSLDALNARLDLFSRESSRLGRALYQDYTSEIDSLSRNLQGSRGRTALLARIEALDRERSRLAAGMPTPGRPDYNPGSTAFLRLDPSDTPEEVRDKLNLAGDLSARVQRSLTRIDSDIRRIRDESAVRRRIGEFTQDLALFDQGLASRRVESRLEGPQRSAGDVSAGYLDRGIVSTDKRVEGDFALPPEDMSAGGVSLDRDLHDPEREQALLAGLGSLSPAELDKALARLQARRDSLVADLQRLSEVEKSLRGQAAGLGIGKEEAGPR